MEGVSYIAPRTPHAYYVFARHGTYLQAQKVCSHHASKVAQLKCVCKVSLRAQRAQSTLCAKWFENALYLKSLEWLCNARARCFAQIKLRKVMCMILVRAFVRRFRLKYFPQKICATIHALRKHHDANTVRLKISSRASASARVREL